jgi:hypothetical protein
VRPCRDLEVKSCEETMCQSNGPAIRRQRGA